MQNHPGSLPLGGSLDALKEGMAEEEDPQYTYARDPGAVGVGMNAVMNIIIIQNYFFSKKCLKRRLLTSA